MRWNNSAETMVLDDDVDFDVGSTFLSAQSPSFASTTLTERPIIEYRAQWAFGTDTAGSPSAPPVEQTYLTIQVIQVEPNGGVVVAVFAAVDARQDVAAGRRHG